MKRHNSRILAMMTLYQHDLIDHSKMKDILEEDKINAIDTYNEIHGSENEVEYDETFYYILVKGVLAHIEELDEMISKNLVKWTIDRLSFVDKAILRLATFEMMFTQTPKQIVINEAIDITGEYVDTEDFPAKKFNNKVLDNIKETLNGRQ